MVGETFDSGQVFTEAVDDFTALFYYDGRAFGTWHV